MRSKKETILLDAYLKAVIDKHAFGAELQNKHSFVAYFYPEDEGVYHPEVGDKVTVEMSPYDMSKGRLVFKQG